MEYKLSFFIQVFWMVINDFFFFFIWILLFKTFWTIGWIQIWDMLILLSILVMVFWIVHTFFNWYYKLWIMIEEWKLDNYMLLPKNLIIKLLINSMNISAIWDLIYSFLLIIFIPNLTFLIVFEIIFYSIIWSITFIWVMLFFISISFYFWSSKNLSRAIMEWLLWPSHYPPGIFEKTILKFFFMTILPVFFINFWAYYLIKSFNLSLFIGLLSWSFFFLILWIFTFYSWLKRYESWNMINVNI